LNASKLSKFVENLQDMIFQFLSGTLNAQATDISVDNLGGISPIAKNEP
jgi:hypothetical protein